MSSSQSSESISNVFSVRIVSIDYYMAPPIPDFSICHSTLHGSDVKEVPVIRIYGSTLAGQKTCLHVHQALPYLYVPCSELPPQMPEKADAYLHAVCLTVENTLSRKNSLGTKKQHVHGCSFVRAKKFYGYHSSEELFVKIYLYYPNDVARIAALLLGGAIFDRTIQPYESHIPFLLQFLIDYNLYGMSHLHTSRVKFRRPLPNNFIPRINLSKNQDEQVEKSPRLVSFQADTSSESNQCFRIWLSSNVPRDWTWSDGLDLKMTNLIQRQSICELEGDSCINDIQNQITKNYTTLSQSREDMKMVQSLIPIWDEEYERTGVHETVNLFKDGKPPPESILRNFLDRPGNEFAYSSFLTKVEVPSPLKVYTPDAEGTPDLKPSTNMKSSMSHTNDTLNPTRESPLVNYDHNLHFQGERSSNHLLSATRRALLADSTNIGASMVTDVEGVRLLNWLASSQAVDEINSDNELDCEVILSPLFRRKAYEKVLEEAHLDYEIASQRECQDIIDSIEDIKNDSMEDSRDSFTDNEYVSLDSMIPQFDGSHDDQVENPMIKEFETTIKSESRIAIKQDGKKISRKAGGRCKRNTSLWGSLPFSTKKELVGSETSSVKSMETSTDFNETRLDSECSLSENEEDDNQVTSKISRNLDENQLGSVSLRKMMRKKRSPHSEFAECKKHIDATVPFENSYAKSHSIVRLKHGNESFCNVSNCLKRHSSIAYVPLPCSNVRKNELINESLGRNIDLDFDHHKNKHMTAFSRPVEDTVNIQHSVTCSKKLKDDFVQNSMEHANCDPLRHESIDCDFNKKKEIDYKLDDRVLCSRYPSNSILKCSSFKGSNCIGNRSRSSIVDTEGMSDTNLVNQKANSKHLSDALLTETDTRDQKMKPTVDLIHTSQIDIDSMKSQAEYFDMTFYQKPPTVEQVNNAKEIVNVSPINFGTECNPKHALTRRLFPINEKIDVHAVTSFFKRNDKDKGLLDKPDVAPHSHQEVRGGIPIHFQNDGSPLYLLTYALSPPSLDSVSQFVSKLTQDIIKEKRIFEDVNMAGCAMSKIKLSSHNTNSHVPMIENLNTDSCHYENVCDLKLALNHSSDENTQNSTPGKKNNTPEIDSMASKPHLTPSEGLGPNKNWHDASQISGPDRKSKLTPLSQTGFRDPASMGCGQQLTLLSIEVQAESRGDLRPDPRLDAVNIVTIVIQEDNNFDTQVYVLLHYCGKEASWRNVGGISNCQLIIASDEKNMFQHLIKLISSSDPDILMGWETQGSSLGFLAERAAHIDVHFLKNISRTPVFNEVKVCGNANKEGIDSLVLEVPVADSSIYEDGWSQTHGSGFHVGGRIVLNLWRLMRSEVKLNMYTIEAVAEEVLRLKIPYIPCSVLNRWFTGGSQRAWFQCIEYIIEKAKLNLTIINQLDMINRTSELARVFGIDFFSVLSRGSQFRVESMLLRLAHTQNFLAVSPGNQQVSLQPAMECLPLVMEPVSGFYSDPVVVLDFQSLYPSMIIAYNLCFSTCLGKVLSKDILGVSSYSPDKRFLHNLGQQILISPNEVMYVPKKVREGVLPRLLEEILSTRIMIKQKMKKLSSSKRVLQRIYNARQLALKLIANVTYGYTAAGFSGRMPCAELADSIVQCGRRTLETAISFVNSHNRWKATVVYGDTDSMFVHLKGRTLEEAFEIGNEIASAITAINPNPVTLKFEKVYYPCFLLTKKRYVGYSYEFPGQETPTYDAKGIETVRRDTCPVVAKILERSLRIFFEHQNIPDVKSYLQRQWTRILRGKCSLQDFIFAKEVRLGTYSANAYAIPPAAIVATRRMRKDPRSEPLYGERVPYIVIHGEPGARLVDMVVDPLDILDINSPYRLNDGYYINKQIIPALERVFGLLCVDLKQWYSEIHHPVRAAFAKCYSHGSFSDGNKKMVSRKHSKRSRIDGYFFSKHCCLCGGLVETSAYVCSECSKNDAVVAAAIIGKTCKLERDAQHLSAICRHCGGGDWMIESGVKCTSLACSVFYERRKVEKELKTMSSVATDAGLYPRCMVEWF